MTAPRIGRGAGNEAMSFLFSPSASYPQPFACLIDRQGQLVHAWSSTLDQPTPETDPPPYLRGWNHVELAEDASLYAMVPLHALLKLRPDSTLAWRVELPVHHDLDIGPGGEVYVLTEEPRSIPWRGGAHVLLDNTVTVLSQDGELRATHSLYDILSCHPELNALIEKEIEQRRTNPHLADPAAYAPGPNSPHPGREASRLLRELPGSPSDVLHANTVELLGAHPAGLWSKGDVLVAIRNLDLIAVLDLTAHAVRWFWGPGELSGPHQPSARANGNVLVFDNGQREGRSRVLEIDPTTGQVVWRLSADPPEALFCPLAGGCEELPGGTILISDAQGGRGIEVTREGRITWSISINTLRSSAAGSREEFYRMAPISARVAALLGRQDGAARKVVGSRLRCEPREDLPLTLGSAP